MAYKSLLTDIKEDKVSSLYLFFGREIYLINKGIDALKDRYFNNTNGESFNYNFFDGISDDIDSILSTCETLPFMGEKRIVIVKSKDIFSGNKSVLRKEDEERLVEYITNVPETTCLVFIAGERIDKRKRLVKEIKANGKILEFNKLNRTYFLKWIQKILKSNNKKIGASALEMLIDYLGYLERDSNITLYDVENEVIKLCNYADDKTTIELDDIEKIMTKPLENNIFLLVDAVSDKNSGLALKMFNQMLVGGEPEGRILYMIVRQFNILNKVKLMVDRGYTAIAIAPKIALPQYIAKKYVRQSNSFSDKALLKILNFAVEMERKIKTGQLPSKLAIEMMITEFCR